MQVAKEVGVELENHGEVESIKLNGDGSEVLLGGEKVP